VSQEQLKNWVARAPAFRDQLGQFNPDVFRRTLYNASLSEAEFFQSLRGDIKREQMTSAISGAAAPADILTETLFRYRAERRSADVVRISIDSIIDAPEPTAGDLSAHYEANKDDYMAPEYRGATYVSLTPEALAKEILIPEADLRAEYDARRSQLTRPATRDIQQFLFPDEAAATAATTTLTRSLDQKGIALAMTAAAGEDSSISLGEITANDLANEAERTAAFAVNTGEVTAPVETPFGWKVFLIKSATPESTPPFEEVSEFIRLNLAHDKALDALFELANGFEDALAGGSTIEEAAREVNVKTQKVAAVDARGLGKDGKPVQGLPVGRRFLSELAKTLKGNQSALTETEGGGYFLLRVDGVIDPRLRDLHEVDAAVRRSWSIEKRLSIAVDRASALAEKSKGGIGLKAAAAALGYHVTRLGPFNRSGAGIDVMTYPEDLAPIVFELTKGDVGFAESDTGAAVAELTEIIAADRTKQKTAWSNVVQELTATMRQDYVDTFLASLRREFDVSIDRGYIDTLLAESQ
jgi:peptidyl-prolyl cis-trans isomerase D